MLTTKPRPFTQHSSAHTIDIAFTAHHETPPCYQAQHRPLTGHIPTTTSLSLRRSLLTIKPRPLTKRSFILPRNPALLPSAAPLTQNTGYTKLWSHKTYRAHCSPRNPAHTKQRWLLTTYLYTHLRRHHETQTSYRAQHSTAQHNIRYSSQHSQQIYYSSLSVTTKSGTPILSSTTQHHSTDTQQSYRRNYHPRRHHKSRRHSYPSYPTQQSIIQLDRHIADLQQASLP